MKFHEWLDAMPRADIPQAPAKWICQVGNLRPVASAGEKVEIKIRDFDQSVIGNPAHDLIRLGLGMAIAVRK